tara:strand:- start:6458 stop:7363 length:906 start_codon:yes stop_codon:yes gene_type:complete
MAFGIVVNGISIPDEKVIAVHDLADHVSPAVVGSKVGLLKSQVLEVRKWLRDGLAEEIVKARKNMKARTVVPKQPAAQRVRTPKPAAKAKAPAEKRLGREPSALEVLSVIASSKSRVAQKDIVQATGFSGRKVIQTILKGLREKKLVDYKHPGTYSPTLEGINHLRLRNPDCKPHKKALDRAREVAYAVKVESEPKEVSNQVPGKIEVYCKECGAKDRLSHSDDCPVVKHVAKKLTESIEKQSGSVAGCLADIDTIFEKQAIQKLGTQVELLNKIHALTGKLAEEMKQSLAEVKTFLGSND